MKKGSALHRACRRSFGVSLAVLTLCAFLFAPKMQAQIVQDEEREHPCYSASQIHSTRDWKRLATIAAKAFI